jgi:hypothetical protein
VDPIKVITTLTSQESQAEDGTKKKSQSFESRATQTIQVHLQSSAKTIFLNPGLETQTLSSVKTVLLKTGSKQVNRDHKQVTLRQNITIVNLHLQ